MTAVLILLHLCQVFTRLCDCCNPFDPVVHFCSQTTACCIHVDSAVHSCTAVCFSYICQECGNLRHSLGANAPITTPVVAELKFFTLSFIALWHCVNIEVVTFEHDFDDTEDSCAIACRFEAMAIQYDSDDIGELDDEEEGGIAGTATMDQFAQLLTEFLEQHPTQDHNHEAGYAYDAAGGAADGQASALDKAAVAKVHHAN